MASTTENPAYLTYGDWNPLHVVLAILHTKGHLRRQQCNLPRADWVVILPSGQGPFQSRTTAPANLSLSLLPGLGLVACGNRRAAANCSRPGHLVGEEPDGREVEAPKVCAAG